MRRSRSLISTSKASSPRQITRDDEAPIKSQAARGGSSLILWCECSTKYTLPGVLDSLGLFRFPTSLTMADVSRAGRAKRARYWQGLIEEHCRSGLSVVALCRERKMAPTSFYQWCRCATGPASVNEVEVSRAKVFEPTASTSAESHRSYTVRIGTA